MNPFDAIFDAGWTILSLGDRGPSGWHCTIAKGYQAPAATWVTGKGAGPAEAMEAAVKLMKKSPEKVADDKTKRRGKPRADDDELI